MITDPTDRSQEQRDPAAESTDFRSHTPAPSSLRRSAPDTASYAGTGKSIRFRSRSPRGGLALRLTLPVAVAALLSLALICLLVRSNARSTALADLRAETASVAFMAGAFARVLLEGAADRPEAGDSVSEIGNFLDSSAANTEIVALFILDAEDAAVASVRKDSFHFDAAALRAVPRIGVQYDVGNTSVIVDHVAEFEPEPLMRGTARIFSNDAEKRRLGAAIAVLRTRPHLARAGDFLLLLPALSALLACVIAAAAWLSGRRIAIPLKRLSADMLAIAEGDYARRAAVREGDETFPAAQAFNAMAERLRLADLNGEEAGRMQADLATAREIQENLLPRQSPRVRGLDIHTACRPAKAVGGDYFDFLPVDDERMGLAIADASGKSVPAALVMATTRAIFRFVAPGVASAAETLSRVNAILSVDVPKSMFVTAYYVILEPLAQSMLCASAGHTPLLLARRDGSVEMLNPGGIALGFDGGGVFQRSIREQRVRLEQGDRALLYTDGVVECANAEDEEYSERRLREFLRRNREMSSRDFTGALMADLDRHRGPAGIRDDTTIVTFRVL